ncbi:MAG: gamma-glutamylcyclotransferase [Chitinophagales bacterium]|nr:gamma-glutamylcyclotransferase [Chitinophagales bacterium]
MMLNYFFTYGTIRLGSDITVKENLQKNAVLLNMGFIKRAKLYTIDGLPAYVQEGNDDDIVVGDIYFIKDQAFFQELDKYEGVEYGKPPKEFIREKVTAHLEGSEIECWIYKYAQPIPRHAEWIESGDFLNP